MDTDVTTEVRAVPWNKGKLLGQKPPLKLKEIWAIRVRLQLARQARELALFNLAIDSKLRGCDLVGLRVRDVSHGSRVAGRAIVMQKKTERPVQFEITEQTRDAIAAWITAARRMEPDHADHHPIGRQLHDRSDAPDQQATSTIPIVMGVSSNPVEFGLIKSLAKPEGNTTGVTSQLIELSSKRLEMLREVVPKLKDVAVLSNLALPGLRKGLEETESAARRLGVRVRSYGISADTAALESVFAAIARERPDGLVVQPDPLAGRHGARIAEFAEKYRLPAIGGGRQFVIDGGLLSYGGSFTEGWRLAARYVDKILKGAKPADLPVEQPSTFELAINVKTAKTLGLTIPQSLLLRANEVIQ